MIFCFFCLFFLGGFFLRPKVFKLRVFIIIYYNIVTILGGYRAPLDNSLVAVAILF